MSDDVQATLSNLTDSAALAKIGDVTTRWAFLEAIVEDIIASLLGTDLRFTYVLTTNINIVTRIKIIEALGHLRLDDADEIRLNAILVRASATAPLRNKIVHGLWSTTNIDGVFQVSDYRSRGKLKYRQEYFTGAYLDWVMKDISDTSAHLLAFGKEFGWF
jgi:hypothetical protein